MIVRTLGLAAAVVMAVSSVSYAQSTVTDAVFSEVEKRIIRDYYGIGADGQTSNDRSAPDWAVKDQDDQDEDRGDAAASDRNAGEKKKAEKDKGDKNKGNKNKGDKAKGEKDASKGLPPGLAKRDQLPPGLAKQLKENGRLPPGLAKRDLPADLAAQLPSRPSDQDVTVVNGDVVLVDRATGIILDILKDVVAPGTGANGGAGDPSARPNGTLAAPPSQGAAAQDTGIGGFLKSIFGSGN